MAPTVSRWIVPTDEDYEDEHEHEVVTGDGDQEHEDEARPYGAPEWMGDTDEGDEDPSHLRLVKQARLDGRDAVTLRNAASGEASSAGMKPHALARLV